MGVAESRFHRVATFVLFVTMVSTGIADVTAVVHQAPYLAAWWWWPTAILNLGAVAGYLVCAIVSVRMARVVAGVYAVGSLLAITLIPFAGEIPDDLGSVWPLRMTSTLGLSAGLAFGARGLWIYVALLTPVSLFALWVGSGDLLDALNTKLVNLSVAIPFALILLVVLRTGRVLDAAAASAIDAVKRDAAGAAESLERRRVELLAHDDILYTLRATALGFPTAELARTSLEHITQLDDPPETDIVTRLRSITALLAPAASFSAGGDGTVPPDASDALVEAAGEALRNSVLHAPGAARTVTVVLAPDGARVTVSDDGPGFRPTRLPVGRLGVSRSIVERMDSILGGSARITSAPGRGTSVELDWTA